MRARGPRAAGLRRWLLLLGGALLASGCAMAGDSDLPLSALDPAPGTIAEQLDGLWRIVFPIAVLVFILVQGLILVAVFRFRARGDEPELPKQVAGNTRLEIFWTVVPAVILAVIAVPTVRTIFEVSGRPDDADVIDVRVVGKQYWWEFSYPDDQEFGGLITASELHIPVDRQVFLTLDGTDQYADVIHSFWVPRLAGKQDYVPGHQRTLRLYATEPGVYQGQCAEFCGLSHANMRFVVVAHTAEDFAAWVESNAAETGPKTGLAAQGEEIAGRQCVGCHAIRGNPNNGDVRLGPDLTHFAQRERFAGYIAESTEDNLARWLDNPQSIKPGAQMPDLGLSQEEIDALVAYLLSND